MFSYPNSNFAQIFQKTEKLSSIVKLLLWERLRILFQQLNQPMREILFDTSFLGYPMYPKRTLDTLQASAGEPRICPKHNF